MIKRAGPTSASPSNEVTAQPSAAPPTLPPRAAVVPASNATQPAAASTFEKTEAVARSSASARQAQAALQAARAAFADYRAMPYASWTDLDPVASAIARGLEATGAQEPPDARRLRQDVLSFALEVIRHEAAQYGAPLLEHVAKADNPAHAQGLRSATDYITWFARGGGKSEIDRPARLLKDMAKEPGPMGKAARVLTNDLHALSALGNETAWALVTTSHLHASERIALLTFDRFTLTKELAERKLGHAADILARGDGRFAAELAGAVLQALPSTFEVDIEAMFAALKEGVSAKDAAAAARDASRAAFDADPARNRGFRHADLEALTQRARAIQASSRPAELEGRLRMIEPHLAANPSWAWSQTGYLLDEAKRLEVGPALIAEIARLRDAASTTYLADKLRQLEGVSAGASEGLLAVGYDKLHGAQGALHTVRLAAEGKNPLQHDSVAGEPNRAAVRAIAELTGALSMNVARAKQDLEALITTAKGEGLARAYELVRDDLALGHGVVEMSLAMLGREVELAPLSYEVAKVTLEVTERAAAANLKPTNDLGVPARDAHYTLQKVAGSEHASAELRAAATALAPRTDALLKAIRG